MTEYYNLKSAQIFKISVLNILNKERTEFNVKNIEDMDIIQFLQIELNILSKKVDLI